MTDSSDDRLLDALRDLPPADVDPVRAERIRRVARRVFVEAHADARARSFFERAWFGVIEPALLGATAIVYLTWAIRSSAALFH